MQNLENYLYNVNNSKPDNTKYYIAGGLAAVLLLVLIVVLSRPSTEKFFHDDHGDGDLKHGQTCKWDEECLSGWCNSTNDRCDGNRLEENLTCHTGDENQCKSGDCDCDVPHSSGPTCKCEHNRLSNGNICHSGDNDECQSGKCDCDFPYFSGSTCKCA